MLLILRCRPQQPPFVTPLPNSKAPPTLGNTVLDKSISYCKEKQTSMHKLKSKVLQANLLQLLIQYFHFTLQFENG